MILTKLASVEDFNKNIWDYEVVFSPLLGNLLRHIDSGSSVVISSQFAANCIQTMKDSDKENPFFKR